MNHLALRIPHFAAVLEVQSHPLLEGSAFALCSSFGTNGQVLAVSAEAAALGARVGQALPRLPATVQPQLYHSPHHKSGQSALLKKLEALFPAVQAGQDGFHLIALDENVRHSADPLACARKVLTGLHKDLGLHAAVGIGQSALAATLLAKRAEAGEIRHFIKNTEEAVIDGFPLDLLDLPNSLICDLADTGVHSIGDAKRLPSEQLARIYGQEGRKLIAYLLELRLPEDTKLSCQDRLRVQRLLPIVTAKASDLRCDLLEMLDELLDQVLPSQCEVAHLMLQLRSSKGHSILRGLHCKGQQPRAVLRKQILQLLEQATDAKQTQIDTIELQALLRQKRAGGLAQVDVQMMKTDRESYTLQAPHLTQSKELQFARFAL
jgi:nucleotidyltransferase/DNA polymerase involved in DNA repair